MKLSRKEIEKNFKKDFVGNAAYELFAHHSFDRVSMDEIARKAEFGKGTLYKLFSGKEEILVYIICRGIDQLCSDLQEQCLGCRDSFQALEHLIELEYDFYTDYSNLVLALLFRQSDGDLNNAFLNQIREKHQHRNQLVAKIIDKARDSGLLFRVENREFIRALESMMKGLMINHIESQSMSNDREFDLTLIKALLWEGLIEPGRLPDKG